jgi:hypothetical protein
MADVKSSTTKRAPGDHIVKVTAADAFAIARGNKLRRYPSPDSDGERLYPLASPTANPSFRIGAEDTIFAIGSCFARNVEKALLAAGKRVLSREFELGEVGESLGETSNFFNKYSIHSVLNELRWALDRETFPGEGILYPLGKGTYSDPQLGIAKLDFPVDEILAFRHAYLDAMRQVAEADVIILTLGYVETWYDTKLDLYLNITPPVQLVKAEPDRFEFRVLSYHDVLDALEELYTLLNKHRTKPLKMLVTVSPVPLIATFRDMDVLVANTYSKSVQRAALDEFLIGKEGVDYFPSFEFVTLSNPTIAWSRGDYRHVSPDVVARIMSNVLVNYVDGAEDPGPAQAMHGEAMTPQALQASVRMMLKLEDYDGVVALTRQNRALIDEDAELLVLEANALRRLNQLEASYEALEKAVGLAPRQPAPLERLITLCRPLGRKEDAVTLVARHKATFPGRSQFRDKVTWL